VGFTELALTTRQAAGATKQYFLFFVAAGLLYLALSLASTYLFALLERFLRRGQPKLG
jgi:polar amino acid transport system permease protein